MKWNSRSSWMLMSVLVAGFAGPGCTESTKLENDTGSGTDSARDTETAVDPESETETDSVEIPEHAAAWPLMDCVYLFHVTEKATAEEIQNETYSAVDDVEPYDVAFNNELRTIEVNGPDPFTEGGRVTSAESTQSEDSIADELHYPLQEFLMGGLFTAERHELGYAAATLDFFGSGVPVMLRYRGYLDVLDCGPPPVFPPRGRLNPRAAALTETPAGLR